MIKIKNMARQARPPLSVLACASAIPNKRRLYIESPSLFSMLLKPQRSLS